MISRRRSDLDVSRRSSTGSRRNSLLSISLFDFPPTPGAARDTFSTGYHHDPDPFAPLSIGEPFPLSLSPRRCSKVVDRLLGDRSEGSVVSVPTVVTASSYSSHKAIPLIQQQQQHQQQQQYLASTLFSRQQHLNITNPLDHYQRHSNPITPLQLSSSKPSLGSVANSSTLAMAAPIKSLNETTLNEDDDDDDDEDGEDSNRFKPFHEEKWTLRYKELLEFHKKHGHAAVPHTFPENPQLARWVKRQRRQYKLRRDNRQSTMTTERLEMLNSVGFIWDSHDVNWREKLDSLGKFRQERGHCNVPSNYRDKKLATWVKCQRRQYKLYWDGKPSAMSPERIMELEKLGFEWEIRSAVPRNVKQQQQQPLLQQQRLQQETSLITPGSVRSMMPNFQSQSEQMIYQNQLPQHHEDFNFLYQTMSDS